MGIESSICICKNCGKKASKIKTCNDCGKEFCVFCGLSIELFDGSRCPQCSSTNTTESYHNNF